jgi:sterol desaturase/sphingolipid hydroxylase (fatty acid hydroxylase superfamily)
MLTKFSELFLWFSLAFIVASFIEYWMHRLMHYLPRICKVHTEHHRRNEGQGVLGEFLDYLKGGFVVLFIMFLHSWEVGLSWLFGAIAYAAFAAYAHQLQHENPTACFWMKMPVHYVHHEHKQWHHNFGLGLDWWDRLFGTYKPVDWLTEKEKGWPQKSPLALKWH